MSDETPATIRITCPRHYEVSVSATMGQPIVTLSLDKRGAEGLIHRLCEEFGEEWVRSVVDTP